MDRYRFVTSTGDRYELPLGFARERLRIGTANRQIGRSASGALVRRGDTGRGTAPILLSGFVFDPALDYATLEPRVRELRAAAASCRRLERVNAAGAAVVDPVDGGAVEIYPAGPGMVGVRVRLYPGATESEYAEPVAAFEPWTDYAVGDDIETLGRWEPLNNADVFTAVVDEDIGGTGSPALRLRASNGSEERLWRWLVPNDAAGVLLRATARSVVPGSTDARELLLGVRVDGAGDGILARFDPVAGSLELRDADGSLIASGAAGTFSDADPFVLEVSAYGDRARARALQSGVTLALVGGRTTRLVAGGHALGYAGINKTTARIFVDDVETVSLLSELETLSGFSAGFSSGFAGR